MTLGEAGVLGGVIVQTLAVLAMFLRLNVRIDDLSTRIDGLGERLDARIDALVTSIAEHTARHH